MSAQVLSGMDGTARDAAVEATRANCPAGGAAQIRLAADTHLTEKPAGLSVPTLVVVTDADRLVHPHTQRRLAQSIPGAEVLELRGAGHTMDTGEAQTWIEHTRVFLARHHI